jgi:hypothetical protein
VAKISLKNGNFRQEVRQNPPMQDVHVRDFLVSEDELHVVRLLVCGKDAAIITLVVQIIRVSDEYLLLKAVEFRTSLVSNWIFTKSTSAKASAASI